MADNFGVITNVCYCFVEDIENCVVFSNGVLLRFKSGKNWSDFSAGAGNIDIKVKDESESGNPKFTISGRIKISRLRSGGLFSGPDFKNRKVILKCNTANSDEFVVGDIENPVKIKRDILNPSDVNSASGIEYYPSGVMTHSELPIL